METVSALNDNGVTERVRPAENGIPFGEEEHWRPEYSRKDRSDWTPRNAVIAAGTRKESTSVADMIPTW